MRYRKDGSQVGVGAKRYMKNTACGGCGGPVRRGFLYCQPCGTARLAAYQGTAGQLSEEPGPNRIACCGTFSEVLTKPLRTACCGRALELPTPQSLTPEGRV